MVTAGGLLDANGAVIEILTKVLCFYWSHLFDGVKRISSA